MLIDSPFWQHWNTICHDARQDCTRTIIEFVRVFIEFRDNSPAEHKQEFSRLFTTRRCSLESKTSEIVIVLAQKNQ